MYAFVTILLPIRSCSIFRLVEKKESLYWCAFHPKRNHPNDPLIQAHIVGRFQTLIISRASVSHHLWETPFAKALNREENSIFWRLSDICSHGGKWIELLWRKLVQQMSASLLYILYFGCIFVKKQSDLSLFFSFAVFSGEPRQGLPLQFCVSLIACLLLNVPANTKLQHSIQSIWFSILIGPQRCSHWLLHCCITAAFHWSAFQRRTEKITYVNMLG